MRSSSACSAVQHSRVAVLDGRRVRVLGGQAVLDGYHDAPHLLRVRLAGHVVLIDVAQDLPAAAVQYRQGRVSCASTGR